MLQHYIAANLGGILSRLENVRAVELGSGCAVGGMALALAGARVTFTDKEEIMDHCHENVKRNLGASPALWHSCTFAPFCGEPTRGTPASLSLHTIWWWPPIPM